jgi:hypothetical protein
MPRRTMRYFRLYHHGPCLVIGVRGKVQGRLYVLQSGMPQLQLMLQQTIAGILASKKSPSFQIHR